jgi:hypothetical protein
MVSFIRKRLQVFVSSTYSDLISERQAAVEAILTAGHIPAGMELFTSGDESQMDVIKQWIDESDVYLLIQGGRYGSIEPKTGKSYTQLEYEYALSLGKPLFACVITETALENHVKVFGTGAIEMDNPQKLKDFRTLVLTKMVRFWNDPKDIKISIGETLSQISRRDDLTGWVRASQEVNMPALADEIARLSKENAMLRSQVAIERNREGTINGLSFDELKEILQSKGLLEPLIEIRPKFGEQYGIRDGSIPSSMLTELSVLGIIKINPRISSPIFYILSDAGQIFLNRLEARRLNPAD